MRWSIEVFFRNVKSYLGINSNMLRTSVGIRRLWAINLLAYNICMLAGDSFSERKQALSKEELERRAEFSYEFAFCHTIEEYVELFSKIA